jgi:hypothetical protein
MARRGKRRGGQAGRIGYANGGSVGDDTVYAGTAPDWGAFGGGRGEDPAEAYKRALFLKSTGYGAGYANGGAVRRSAGSGGGGGGGGGPVSYDSLGNVVTEFSRPLTPDEWKIAQVGPDLARGGPVRGYQEGGEVEDEEARRRRAAEEAALAEQSRARENQPLDIRSPADTGYRDVARAPVGMPTGYGGGERAPAAQGSAFSKVLDYLHDSFIGRAQAAEAPPAALATGYGQGVGGYGGELVSGPPTRPQSAYDAARIAGTVDPQGEPVPGRPLSLRSEAPPTISGQATPAVPSLPGSSRLAEVEREIAARPQVDTSQMGTLEKIARVPGALLERAGDTMRRADAERELFTGTRFGFSNQDTPWLPGLQRGIDNLLRGDRSHTPAEVHQVLRTISDDPQADHNPMVQKTFDSLKTIEDKAAFTQTLRDPYNRYMGIAQAAIDRGDMSMALKFIEQAHNLLPNNQKLNIVPDKNGSFTATIRPEGVGGGNAYSVRLTDPRDIYNLATTAMQFDTVGKVGLQKVFERMATAKADAAKAEGDKLVAARGVLPGDRPVRSIASGEPGYEPVQAEERRFAQLGGRGGGSSVEPGPAPQGAAVPGVPAGARVNVREMVGPGPAPDDPNAVLANREQVQQAIQGSGEREEMLQREARGSPAAIEGRRTAAAAANVAAQEEAARNRFVQAVQGRPDMNAPVPLQGEVPAVSRGYRWPTAAPATQTTGMGLPAGVGGDQSQFRTGAASAATPAAASQPELPQPGLAEGVASKISGTPPPSAIQALLKYANDPRIKADFDAKYGAGATQRILKQYGSR